jgi:hypothetical protein
MKLTKEYFEQWLNGLKQIWLDKNLNGLQKYFGKIERYYENPFKIGRSFGEVLGFWEEIKNQEIIKLEMNGVAIDGNVGIAHWFFSDKSGEYDGIYQVTYNDNLECIEFKQWCVAKKL